MYKLIISGIKRTNPEYLTTLFKPFVLTGDRKPFNILNNFATFDLTQSNNTFFLKIDEFKRSLQFNYPFSLTLFYPNVFGNAELFKFNVNPNRNWKLNFEKPFGKILLKIFCGNKCGIEILNEKWGIQLGHYQKKVKDPINTNTRTDNFLRFVQEELIYDKIGIFFSSVFNNSSKVQIGSTRDHKPYALLSFTKAFSYWRNYFFMKIKFTENIFISKKKKTFTGLKGEVGLIENKKGINAEIYCFYATSIESKQVNLLDTWKSFLYAQVIMPKISNYNACIGTGIKIPIRNQKINIMYRWGLINKETSGLGIKFEI